MAIYFCADLVPRSALLIYIYEVQYSQITLLVK